jgi:hypothetical protein
MIMAKTFDTYCIDAADLDVARARLEAAIPVKFALHESMFWGGDYYLAKSPEIKSMTIRRNFNSFTKALNEERFPDCHMVVSVNEPSDPQALEAVLVAHGLRLLRRSVV